MGDVGPDAIVGLLAEESRLKVVAAIALGAHTESEVTARTALAPKAVRRALDRLIRGGIVETTADRRLRVATQRFREAAQRAAAQRPQPRPEDLGATADQAQVLRNFLVDGRLTHIPVTRSKRLVVLDWLAGRFDPGRVYPERDVGRILSEAHPDHAALRRYLVDEGFLERRDGFYWRAGGAFDVD